MPELTVSESGDYSFIGEALASLKYARVLVGIPEDETNRNANLREQAIKQVESSKNGKLSKRSKHLLKSAESSEHVTNAGLMYIHTNGSPKRHIPARPVIEPSIEANRKNLEAGLAKVIDAEFAGDKALAETLLRRVGQMGSNGAKRWFTDPRNGWKQNSPLTIRRKLGTLGGKKLKGALKILNSVQEHMPLVGTTALDEINTPLIDTGELRRSITFVVEI